MIDGDVFVRCIKLPGSVKGLTVPNEDGTFTVYINALLSEETQKATLEHEKYHIEHDHLYDNSSAAKAESAAGGVAIIADDDEWLEANKAVLLPLIKRSRLELQIKKAREIRQNRLVANGYARNVRTGKVVCIDIWKDK